VNLHHKIILSTAEVLKRIPQVSPRKLQIWDESSLIPAHRKYGHKRNYTEVQLFQILVHEEAVAAGAGLQHLHRKWADIVSRPEFTTSDYLLLSNKGFVLVKDREELPRKLSEFGKRYRQPSAFVDLQAIRQSVQKMVEDIRYQHGYARAA
jgi:DNA-binding transcriptional MerR regulator